MSNAIKDRYFVASGAEVDAVLAEMRSTAEDHQAQCEALAKQHGAVCLFSGRIPGYSTKPEGLVFHTREAHPGVRYYDNKVEDDGNGGWRDLFLYRPDMRTKVGRALKEALGAIPAFSPSDFIVKRLGVARSIILGGRYVAARAGVYANDTVIVVVPESEKHPFTAPALLREIKRSEFIAITEEQDDEAEAA